MSELTQPSNHLSLEACLEALLFAAPGPVTVAQLAEALECKSQDVESGLRTLDDHYRNGHGLSIQRHQGRIQLTTSAFAAQKVERLLGLEATARLSRAALETLAIVAYRQPVTRPGIDAIRGVNSDGVLKSLLAKGLLEEIGRAEGPGRPILYGTTEDFLQNFGLSSLEDLPPFGIDEQEVQQSDNGTNHRLLKD